MTLRPFSLPGSYLVLELANGCNLRCTHCAQAEYDHPHTQRTGYFPSSGLRSLLEDLRVHQVRFDVLILFWLGEPLLHPEFAEIYHAVLEHAGPRRSFSHVEVHTNATMLTQRVAAEILNRHPAPQRWHLTLDAASRETYLSIKGIDLFERAEENVQRLLELKGRGGFSQPQLILQYIVSDRNEGEVPGFLARWEAALERFRLPYARAAFHVPGDGTKSYLYLKSLDCPTPEEQARQNAVYRRVVAGLGLDSPLEAAAPERLEADASRLASRLATPCSGFWKSPVIGWDGMLTTCTRDSLGANRIGNVLETPFTRLWFGNERLDAWRQRVARGDYSALPLCQTCFIPRSINYSGITQPELQSLEEVP